MRHRDRGNGLEEELYRVRGTFCGEEGWEVDLLLLVGVTVRHRDKFSQQGGTLIDEGSVDLEEIGTSLKTFTGRCGITDAAAGNDGQIGMSADNPEGIHGATA